MVGVVGVVDGVGKCSFCMFAIKNKKRHIPNIMFSLFWVGSFGNTDFYTYLQKKMWLHSCVA